MVLLAIGEDNWPFPLPLVKVGRQECPPHVPKSGRILLEQAENLFGRRTAFHERYSAPKSAERSRSGIGRLFFVVASIHATVSVIAAPGSPVLVKASYFPNWQVSGAKGPYRVAPNQMVVVPTSRHVSLHYGYTPADRLGYALTLLGIVALITLARLGAMRMPPRTDKGEQLTLFDQELDMWGTDPGGNGETLVPQTRPGSKAASACGPGRRGSGLPV